MGKFKRKAFAPQKRAQRVLASCSEDTVHCWSCGPVQMAVFLQSHPEEGVKVKIAYETFHPSYVPFKRRMTCEGGNIGDHDPEKQFEMIPGRTPGRRGRSVVHPDSVKVEPSADSMQVDAFITFGETDLPIKEPNREARFSVMHPGGKEPDCCCCS